MTDEDFKEGMEHGKFLNSKHRAFCELLYYSPVRKAEALRAVREQFQITRKTIRFEVDERLKKVKRLKMCPRCKAKNGRKALACRKCGCDLQTVELTRIGKPLTTHPLNIPLNVPYISDLKQAIEETPKGRRVFPFSPRTAYNIVHRAFKYPHLFRHSRITNFFLEGWSIGNVHSWTGLSLAALEHYTGLADTIRMGESLAKPSETGWNLLP